MFTSSYYFETANQLRQMPYTYTLSNPRSTNKCYSVQYQLD